jgi:hypothetical protein
LKKVSSLLMVKTVKRFLITRLKNKV